MSEFAGSLREVVVIEELIDRRTASGLQDQGWLEVAECHAAIVPDGSGAEAEGAALSALARFRVTIRSGPAVAVGQRVRWSELNMSVRQVITDPRRADRVVLRCEEMRA